MKKSSSSLHSELRARREKLGLDTDTLAFVSGLSPSKIAEFEWDFYEPSDAMIVELQMALYAIEGIWKVQPELKKATPEDLKAFLMRVYRGEFPGYARNLDEWKKTRAHLVRTGEDSRFEPTWGPVK